MGAPTNIIARAREHVIFAVKEATKGTLVFPAAADPVIIPAGYGEMNQNPSFTDSAEIANSRDLLAQFQDMTPAGTFSIPIFARPSGSLGSAPMGDALFESLLGKKTVNAGASVVYSPQMTKPSLSIWMRQGHTVFFASGCVAEDLKVGASNKGGVQLNIGGKLMKMGWAGRDGVKTLASAAATSVQVYDAKKFTVGARIYNVTKNDYGTNGYEVTAVNTTTNTLTLATGIGAGGWAVDDVVQGYLPAGTVVGSALESRKNTITIGGVTKSLKGLDLSYSDAVKMLDDEMSPTGYVTDYIEDMRKTTATAKMYFRQDELGLFTDGLAGNEKAVVVLFGDTAGAKMEIGMARMKVQVPKKQIAAPAVELGVDMTALGTNGEDSTSIMFK